MLLNCSFLIQILPEVPSLLPRFEIVLVTFFIHWIVMVSSSELLAFTPASLGDLRPEGVFKYKLNLLPPTPADITWLTCCLPATAKIRRR